MTDDTIASPGHDGAVAQSAVAADTTRSVSDDSSTPGNGDSAGVVLVEEISIDGMCGVY